MCIHIYTVIELYILISYAIRKRPFKVIKYHQCKNHRIFVTVKITSKVSRK